MLTEQPHNYWFCPNSTKSALNAVFVEKDRRKEAWDICEIYKRVTVLEGNSQAHSNNLKAFETSIEHYNLNINCCSSSLENLK